MFIPAKLSPQSKQEHSHHSQKFPHDLLQPLPFLIPSCPTLSPNSQKATGLLSSTIDLFAFSRFNTVESLPQMVREAHSTY